MWFQKKASLYIHISESTIKIDEWATQSHFYCSFLHVKCRNQIKNSVKYLAT